MVDKILEDNQVTQGLNYMSDAIQQQIKELLAQKAELDKQEAEKAKIKAFEWNSKVKLVKFLEQYLDNHIKLGKLTPDVFFNVYRKYRQVYADQDDQLSFLVSTVIKLISHSWYGVECHTALMGNGGLKYKGKNYEDPQKLYLEVVFNTILGELANDPFETDIWFYELLGLYFDSVEAEDKYKLPALVQTGEVKTKVLPLLKRIIDVEKATQELPELDGLTADDALYIQSLF